jgi:arylsulfatase
MFPTILSIAGDSDVKEKLKKGMNVNGTKFKVHLDGFDQSAYLAGTTDKSPREGFTYFSDEGDIVGLRFDNWKAVFMEQRAQGTLQIWLEPFVKLRAPKLFNLRTDPYERADTTSNTYFDWYFRRAGFILGAAQKLVGDFMATFKEFPPSQKPGSFTIEQADAMMTDAMGSGLH